MDNKVSIEEYLRRNKELTYRNVGVSMLPMLKQGRDLFTVRYYEGQKLEKYDVILFRRSDGRLVLHRIVRVCPDDTYETMGDNCITREKGISGDSVLGVLTSFDRKGKTISADNVFYGIYVRVWCFLSPVRVGIKKIIMLIRQK